MRLAVAAPLAGLVAAGCLATGSVLEYRGTGLARCYRLEYEALWERVVEAVRYAGLVIERENVGNGSCSPTATNPKSRPRRRWPSTRTRAKSSVSSSSAKDRTCGP